MLGVALMMLIYWMRRVRVLLPCRYRDFLAGVRHRLPAGRRGGYGALLAGT